MNTVGKCCEYRNQMSSYGLMSRNWEPSLVNSHFATWLRVYETELRWFKCANCKNALFLANNLLDTNQYPWKK
jgi:hypothetical protein